MAVVDDVVLNQVLVRFGKDGGVTDAVAAAVQQVAVGVAHDEVHQPTSSGA